MMYNVLGIETDCQCIMNELIDVIEFDNIISYLS